MKKIIESPDYSLDAVANKKSQIMDSPKIKSVTVMEVESSDVRCSKGDCDGDYAPG